MVKSSKTAAALLGALLVSAVAAASTSAALPELGRCVPKAGGKFANGSCLKPGAGKTAKFEFESPVKTKFTAAAVVAAKGIAITLETVGGIKLICTGGSISGEYTGAKSSTGTLRATGCRYPALALKCRSGPSAPEGEIASQEFAGELGLIVGGERPSVGLDIKPKSPATTIGTFECGKFPESPVRGTIEGSVIGAIKPVDAMKAESSLKYVEKAAKQTPEKFEGGVKDVLTTTIFIGAEKHVEEAGLKASFVVKDEEPLEIKAK